MWESLPEAWRKKITEQLAHPGSSRKQLLKCYVHVRICDTNMLYYSHHTTAKTALKYHQQKRQINKIIKYT